MNDQPIELTKATLPLAELLLAEMHNPALGARFTVRRLVILSRQRRPLGFSERLGIFLDEIGVLTEPGRYRRKTHELQGRENELKAAVEYLKKADQLRVKKSTARSVRHQALPMRSSPLLSS